MENIIETFDFTKEAQKAETIYKEIDRLSVKQLMQVQNLIKQIKTEEQDTVHSGRDWIRQTIMLVLKEFAEEQGAVLEISEEEKNAVTFTLSELTSFDIGNSCGKLKTIFLLATYTAIEADEDKLRIYLTYEIQDFCM